MPVPSPRSKLLPARGNYADLAANVAELLDGEICYALDQDQYYQKEGSVLVSVGATKAQGLLADTAVQPGDLSDVGASGDYDDLTNKPALATVATTGAYSDLSGTPSLATVATTGDYEDLINKPAASDGSLEWVLTASGLDDYLFNGPGFSAPAADPTITLQRGYTYKFTNNMGAHPFQIQSEIGIGGAAYNDGVTNNGATNGTVVFTVPQNAPDTLYYQCTAHSSMGGTFNIGSASSGGGGVEEAPQDGEQYARQDGGWTVVTGGGGGGGGTGTDVGPFQPKHYHTFDSSGPSECSSDLTGYSGPIVTDAEFVKVGTGAGDGRPTNSGLDLAGDYSAAGGVGLGILTGDPWTISYWFYHDGATEGFTSNIIGCTQSGVNTASGLLIRILSNDASLSQENLDKGIGAQSMCLHNNSGNANVLLGTKFPVMDSVWRHYTWAHDGAGTYRLYIDGALYDQVSPGVQDFSDAGIYGTFNGEFTLMGNRNDTGRCYGIIDNFAIYGADVYNGVGLIPAAALESPAKDDLTYTIPPVIGSTGQLSDFSDIPASAGQIPVSDGTEYSATTPTLGLNSDVDTTGVANGQVLRYDGSKFVPSAGGSGSSTPFSQQAYSYHTFEVSGAAGDPNSSTLFDDWSGNNQSVSGVGAIGQYCMNNLTGPGDPAVMDWYCDDDPVWIEFWYKHTGEETSDQLVVGVGDRNNPSTYPGDNLGLVIRHTFDTDFDGGWEGNSDTTYQGYMGSSNVLVMTVGSSDSPKTAVKTFTYGCDMADGQWHHVAFMVEGVGSNNADGNYSCYVDGALVHRNTGDSSGYPSSNGSWECLTIGNTLTGNRGTYGYIDNFRMWRHDLPVVAGQKYYDINYQSGDPFIAPRQFNEGAPLYTASDVESRPGYRVNQSLFFQPATDEAVAGQFQLGQGFKIVKIYMDDFAEEYRWPSNQPGSLVAPDVEEFQQVGNVVIDAYNWKMAIYTGPYDFNSDAGGWLELSLNPPGGGGGGPA